MPHVPTASSIGPTVYTSTAANDQATFLQPFQFISLGTNAVNVLHENFTVVNMTSLMSGASYGVVVNSVGDCDIINTDTGTIATLAGATGYSAVNMDGNRNVLQNAGSIFSVNGNGVNLSGDDTPISNSGTIRGRDVGILAAGFDYTILNDGTIEAGVGVNPVAVYMTGQGFNQLLVNTGTIRSVKPGEGTAVSVTGANGTTIDNAGLIQSVGGVAIDASAATGALRLTNSGTISGSANFTLSVAATDLSDAVTNSGQINRSVGLGAGDDTFYGVGGTVAGTVFGGDGNDTFHVSDAALAIFEAGGEGTADHVLSTVSFELAAGSEIERLTLLGTATVGTGNQYGNQILGNGSDNLIFGGDGLDLITGGRGDDRLRGDNGNDTVHGDDGDDVVSGGGNLDWVYGGDGDDTVSGNGAADRLFGDAGQDVLIGGAGRDTLTGGFDADVFLFSHVTESGLGLSRRDTIVDLESGLDLIDLTRIDANTLLTGNQAFTFIGTAAFGTVAGQLRAVHGPSSTLFGDVDGDGLADFELVLSGEAVVNVNDLLL